MSNKQIYRKTLGFSLRRVLWDVLAFLLLGVISTAGFFIADKISDKGLIGLLTGIILLVIILRFISYRYKAGQIAMMTKGVTEGSLPEDVIGEGKRIVKERFTTVAAYFAVTGVIKGIFNQLGNGVVKIGESLGGDTGKQVGNVISIAISTFVGFLCDCCLGWVLFRKDVKAARATCEGAVLFFKHGKALGRNMGRIFGMGLASLAVIGGAFTGLFYMIMVRFPENFRVLAAEISEMAARNELDIPQVLMDPATLTIICAAVAGVILWSILHSVFVRPFILVGVLRNFMEAGLQGEIPGEQSFTMLDGKSKKFAKLHGELA